MKTIQLDDKNIKTDILKNTTRYIEADTLAELFMAQGYFHGLDRLMQMEMLRVIAQGRICEILHDSKETLAIDKFMRELGLYHYARLEASSLSNKAQESAKLYCKGVNLAIKENKPFEFKLVSHKIADWKIEDIIATIKVMSFLGLAQGQQDLEKFIIQMIKSDIPKEKIASLVNHNLESLSLDVISCIKQLNLYNPLLPESYKFLQGLPKIQSSNNWLCKNHEESETVYHASDPHLDCNRLPGVWYEQKVRVKGHNYLGISMPGSPGIVMGRNDSVSFSFTYGFMDMIDYFIEEVKGSQYRIESDFVDFDSRKEIIKRKKNNDIELNIRETRNGVLEFDSSSKNLKDGIYLSHAWSCRKSGATKTLEAIVSLFESHSAIEVKECVKDVAISCNWLIADNTGAMIYQQSGHLPKRKSEGLTPLLGWKNDNIWQGFYEGDKLQYLVGEGHYLVTANNKIEIEDFPKSINAPMGDYRRDRILQLLEENKGQYNIEKMKTIQSDLYSLQAEMFITQFREVFEELSIGEKIINWNRLYTTNSKEAVLFEKFYRNLIEDFFSHSLMTKEAINYCLDNTTFIADYYGLFDRLFLKLSSDNPEYKIWFSTKKQNEFIREALIRTEKDSMNSKDKVWGQVNNFDMNHIFFDGKLPKWTGIDLKNIPVPGNRSTIVQGAIYKAHGRVASFCPSWKMVTNMATDEISTILCGGLSDRRFSKTYTSDVNNWITMTYRLNKLNSSLSKN